MAVGGRRLLKHILLKDIKYLRFDSNIRPSFLWIQLTINMHGMVGLTRWHQSGHCLNIKTVFQGMGIFHYKIRRSWDRLIFIMGIPILVRRYLCIKTSTGHLVIISNQTKPDENFILRKFLLVIKCETWEGFVWHTLLGRLPPGLKYWGLIKMAEILQTILSYAFSCAKRPSFWFKCCLPSAYTTVKFEWKLLCSTKCIQIYYVQNGRYFVFHVFPSQCVSFVGLYPV